MIGFFRPIRLEYNQEKYRYNNMTMSMRVIVPAHITILYQVIDVYHILSTAFSCNWLTFLSRYCHNPITGLKCIKYNNTIFYIHIYYKLIGLCILDSEWNDECIDFSMMCVFIFFFFCVCHFKSTVKNKRKIKEKLEFLQKICFRKNRFWFLVQLLS